MPARGIPNNPSGANSFTGPGGQETPYGAVKRLQQSIQQAPIPSVPALNAPRRARRKATRASTHQQAAAVPSTAAPLTPPPAQPVVAKQQVALAAVWAELARTPGAENYPDIAYYANLTNAS